MILIDRKMESTTTTSEKSQYALYSQASFNSDGHITIRNYNIDDKDNDEIIILSTEETQAIFKLFRLLSPDRLPF